MACVCLGHDEYCNEVAWDVLLQLKYNNGGLHTCAFHGKSSTSLLHNCPCPSLPAMVEHSHLYFIMPPLPATVEHPHL